MRSRTPNRLVKAAMAERLADRERLPTGLALLNVFNSWSQSGWGLMITGNVDVDPTYVGTTGDVVVDFSLPRGKILEGWKDWAKQGSKNNAVVLVQLDHPGRQTQWKRGIAPSAIPLDFGPGLSARILNSIVFGTAREMSAQDIKDTIENFADAARLATEAGFAGVEIHGAHGYLLAQFLSPLSNQRTDEYGGTALARAKFVIEVISAVRAVVPSAFCVGIKLNSVDHETAGDLKDCIIQLRAIVDAGVDFLEISGGSFEKPLTNRNGDSTEH